MPEFILDTSGDTAAFDALDDLAKGFIEVVFFTDQCPADVAFTRQTGKLEAVNICPWPMTDEPKFIKRDWLHPEIQHAVREGQSDGAIPSDAGVEDLSPEAIEAVRAFCADWYAKNREIADRAAAIYGMDRVGNDLAYNHGGAGVGFWDRESDLGADLAAALDASAPARELHGEYDAETGTVDIYIG